MRKEARKIKVVQNSTYFSLKLIRNQNYNSLTDAGTTLVIQLSFIDLDRELYRDSEINLKEAIYWAHEAFSSVATAVLEQEFKTFMTADTASDALMLITDSNEKIKAFQADSNFGRDLSSNPKRRGRLLERLKNAAQPVADLEISMSALCSDLNEHLDSTNKPSESTGAAANSASLWQQQPPTAGGAQNSGPATDKVDELATDAESFGHS